jgi:predicted polyphosphate/ATP-dependent NAD kinase
LSPELIRLIGRENVDILATRTKLAQLPLGWLLLDTGDADLDRSLAGLYRVRSGFDDFLLVQVGEAG